VAKRNIPAYRETNPGRPYEWAHLLYVLIRKELLKSCRMSSKLIVLVFTDNNFSCGRLFVDTYRMTVPMIGFRALNIDKKLSIFDFTHSTNVMVDWLTLLFHIREVPGSDLGPESGCLD
jgi:hypothetical protein